MLEHTAQIRIELNRITSELGDSLVPGPVIIFTSIIPPLGSSGIEGKAIFAGRKKKRTGERESKGGVQSCRK